MPMYRIRVSGRLDDCWQEWFSGMTISFENGPDGVISAATGQVADQAALRGILERIWDVNLTVISVDLVQPERQDPAGPRPTWEL